MSGAESFPDGPSEWLGSRPVELLLLDSPVSLPALTEKGDDFLAQWAGFSPVQATTVPYVLF